MDAEASHFGAVGLRDALTALGRFGHPERHLVAACATNPAAAGLARSAVMRLQSIARELAGINQTIGSSLVMHFSPRPHLIMGHRITIEIDLSSGFLLFIERDERSNHIFGTFEKVKLIEHVLKYAAIQCAADGHDSGTHNSNNTLIGKSIKEIERDIIINTLNHCQGNRTRAAKILNISVRTIRNKIQLYRKET